MYHYTDSGLDNIYLVNGYTEHQTPYGRAVSIYNLEGLHDTIASKLVDGPNRLTGAELRFLRHELDISQKRLGKFLGKTEQAVARWEKATDKAVDPIADRMLRLLYLEFKQGGSPVLDLLKRLAEADHKSAVELRLEMVKDSWCIATVRCAA